MTRIRKRAPVLAQPIPGAHTTVPAQRGGAFEMIRKMQGEVAELQAMLRAQAQQIKELRKRFY